MDTVEPNSMPISCLKMLLLWHEALGSDDEQAAEDELCARVLYAQEEDGHHGEERLLQRLHLAQGLLTFVRMLRRRSQDDEAETSAAQWTPEWASVTLSRRRFFVLEVEPQIFMALVGWIPYPGRCWSW